ncbi:MAG: fibronectin type III domain-containing protein [Steroidobacteraceae bacterium]
MKISVLITRVCAVSALCVLAACTGGPAVESLAAPVVDTTPPTVPASVAATKIAATTIRLTWSQSQDSESGVNGYRIYRNGSAQAMASVAASVLSYDDDGLAPNTDYTYTVTAFDAATPANESAPSTTTAAVRTDPPNTSDTTPPSVPSGLGANAPSAGLVNLSWSASTDNAGGSGMAGYRVFRDGVQITSVTGTSYADSSVSGNVTYSYTVAAEDNAGNVSAQSTPAQVTTPAASDTTPPSIPQNVSATANSSQRIDISWSASTDTGGSGLGGYRVLRNGTQVASVGASTTNYSDGGLTPNTTYSYSVIAFDNDGNASSPSSAASATTPGDTTAPPTPGGLSTQTLSTSAIRLSWSSVIDTGGSGLAGYRIYRDGIQINEVGSGQTSYDDTGLAINSSYSYRIAAFDNAGNASPQSAAVTGTTSADTTAPSVPTGLAGNATSSTSVSLTWNASTDTGGSGLAQYRIYRGGSQLANVPAGTTAYTDNTAQASTTYAYTVTAVDGANNESAPSSAVNVTTPAAADNTAPSVPTGLTASAPNAGLVDLSWNASTDNAGGSGLAGYRVFRDGVQITSVTGTSYADSSVSGNVTYSYTVAAEDNAGNVSAQSTPAQVTTPAASDTTPPSIPQNVSATANSSQRIDISWSASTDTGGSGLGGYRVLRNGTQVASVGASTTNYSDGGLTPNTTYSYTVIAFDNDGNASSPSSAASATTPGDTTAPGAPTGLSGNATSSTSVSLTWNASTDTGGSGLAQYRIYRGGSQLGNVPAGTTAYTDNTAQASTSYAYTVTAVDGANNESAPSNTANVTTPAPPDTTAPTVPQGLTATAVSSSQINLSWSASTDNAGGSGLAGYRVRRGGVQIAQVGAGTTTYSDTGRSASTQYSYTVRAYDNAGNESADSNTASATTPAAQVSGMSQRPSNTSCVAPQRPGTGGGPLNLSAPRAFPNLTFPNLSGALQAPGDNSRWFVTQLNGEVRSFANNSSVSSTALVLDIKSRVSTQGEGGLLGLVFHPNFPTDPRAFVHYTTTANGPFQSRISEFRTTDGGATLSASSETVLLTIDQPEINHNGGFIVFSPTDGNLYFGIGDGGGAGDQHGSIGNGQNTQTLLGKILRIDISGTNGSVPYRIPAGNPFAGNAACNVNGSGSSNCPEIFAWGFRNPWKGSFDRSTGQLWVGDVGQDTWEEVDRVNVGGNYGWRCREGASSFNSNCGSAQNLLDPIAQYRNAGGSSVTGGYVYRGSAIPGLVGQYVFADFFDGLYRIDNAASPTTTLSNPVNVGVTLVGFAEDQAGELLLVDYFGSLYHLQGSGGGGGNTIPDQLSQTGCVNASNPTQPASGLIPYAPGAPFWSDGAVKRRWIGLPNGQTISTSGSNGDWDFPNGTVLVKDFSLGNQLIETRLFMKHPDGVWAGYVYEWNAAQTEATRVTNGKDISASGQSWHIPSEAECLQCHTGAAGRSLGLETAQQNSNYAYPSSPSPPFTGNTANQLYTLNSIGVLSPAITDPAAQPAYPDPYGSSGTVAERARAYLHTNCSQCHRPGGGTPVSMDLRYQTTIASTNTCNVDPANPLGIAGAKLIAPGNPAASLIYVRMNQRGTNQMPPIATNLVDTQGAALLNQWISSMNASCQ